MTEDEQECPSCAETIKKKAKVCRFCNTDLSTGKGGKQNPKQLQKIVRVLFAGAAILVLGTVVILGICWLAFVNSPGEKKAAQIGEPGTEVTVNLSGGHVTPFFTNLLYEMEYKKLSAAKDQSGIEQMGSRKVIWLQNGDKFRVIQRRFSLVEARLIDGPTHEPMSEDPDGYVYIESLVLSKDWSPPPGTPTKKERLLAEIAELKREHPDPVFTSPVSTPQPPASSSNPAAAPPASAASNEITKVQEEIFSMQAAGKTKEIVPLHSKLIQLLKKSGDKQALKDAEKAKSELLAQISASARQAKDQAVQILDNDKQAKEQARIEAVYNKIRNLAMQGQQAYLTADYANAESLYRQAATETRKLGNQNMAAAHYMCCAGTALMGEKKYSEAVQALQEAKTIAANIPVQPSNPLIFGHLFPDTDKDRQVLLGTIADRLEKATAKLNR